MDVGEKECECDSDGKEMASLKLGIMAFSDRVIGAILLLDSSIVFVIGLMEGTTGVWITGLGILRGVFA